LLFESTLCTKGIDFRLSISGLLLHFSEAGYFSLLLFLKSALFESCGNFTSNLILVVTDNVLLFVLLL
jgi:hypothetical protein